VREKLVLGSANFGSVYGIACAKKLPKETILEILNQCRLDGVSVIDTASGYGETQRALGSLACSDFDVITKLPPMPPDVAEVETWVRNEVRFMLSDLQRTKLYGLLLHQPADLLGDRGWELVDALHVAKSEFNIQKVGVSVYYPIEVFKYWQVLKYEIIQVPCSVFDQRFASTAVRTYLKEHAVEVHGRSVFMQGLLLASERSLPPYFDPWSSVFDQWINFVKSADRSPLDLCLSFASQQEFIDKWVFGVDSRDHLVEILEVIDRTAGAPVTEGWGAFADLPEDLIVPSRWVYA
jgi:aryl-alcohol dehydrogenase-like predicted oxidoreductase